MEVIPAINCLDFDCVSQRLDQIKALDSDWAHLDVVDGKFAPVKTWNDPKELIRLQASGFRLQVNIEIHLMVENPLAVIEDWFKAGAKRIIIHLETIDQGQLQNCIKIANKFDGEIGLAINPNTPVEELLPFISENQPGISENQRIKFVQILGVNPGWAGQEFQPQVIEKIKLLRIKSPNVKIEADGGINLETAKLVKEAGADIVVSASYIFNSSDPRKAYDELLMATNDRQKN